MRFSAALSAVVFAGTAYSHSRMISVWVNGVDQGDGRNVYIRSPPDNSPVKDLASPNLVCNVNGGVAVSSFAKAAAGDKLSFEWYHDNRNDDIIAASHVGPIITYITPYTETNGVGAIWTKIAEDGFDGSKWAVDKLIANGGKADVTIPAALKAGKYIIRQEIIAHHESDTTFDVNPARGAQFYPSCVQFEITGSGSAVPSQDFDFNTGYKYSDAGIHFNVYSSFSSYSIPGPAVATFEGGDEPEESPVEAPVSSPAAPATTTTAVADPAESTPSPVFTTLPDSAPAAPTTVPTTSATLSTLSTVVRPSPTSTTLPTKPTTGPTPPDDKPDCNRPRHKRPHRRHRRASHKA